MNRIRLKHMKLSAFNHFDVQKWQFHRAQPGSSCIGQASEISGPWFVSCAHSLPLPVAKFSSCLYLESSGKPPCKPGWGFSPSFWSPRQPGLMTHGDIGDFPSVLHTGLRARPPFLPEVPRHRAVYSPHVVLSLRARP